MRLPDSFQAQVARVAKKRMAVMLQAVGEACVAEAVENGNYTDRTGNLRGSIGYVVAVDGQVVSEGGFRKVADGEDGPREGKSLAYAKASESTGTVLVLVAGMKYAEMVADKGYNVLESARLLAKRLVRQLGR